MPALLSRLRTLFRRQRPHTTGGTMNLTDGIRQSNAARPAGATSGDADRLSPWVAVVILALALAGCEGAAQAEAGPVSVAQKVCAKASGVGSVFRCHDPEAHVTCWVFSGASQGEGGISCLPDSARESRR